MSRGVLFAISNILSSLILGIFFAVGLEYLVVNFLFNGVFSFLNIGKIGFSIVHILVLSVFISQIFSKRSLTNFLFVTGYSRKHINSIKTISTFLVVLLVFFLMVGSLFVFNSLDLSIFTNFNFIIYLLSLIFVTLLVNEIGVYVNILYRRKSLKKAKGVDKKVYRYIYTLLFSVIMYSLRVFYSYGIKNRLLITENSFDLISLGCSFIFFMVFYMLNRKNILKLDIK